MKRSLIAIALCAYSINIFCQSDSLAPKKKKGQQWYFSWGYTRAKYSKSTIHFRDLSNDYHPATGLNNYYDFTIHNAVATDRPDFDAIKDVVNLTIPQFVGRVGYYFDENTGIEMNYDHTKYIVTDYQRVHIDGQISGQALNKDTILDPRNFLHFEHSDGANFWMINFVKKYHLVKPQKNLKVGWVIKPGAGVVFPRTDVTIFGERLNNKWHVAGAIVGVETGLHVEFLKYGLFEFVSKGSYANYITCLVLGKGNGKASHQIFTGQLTATIGLCFGS